MIFQRAGEILLSLSPGREVVRVLGGKMTKEVGVAGVRLLLPTGSTLLASERAIATIGEVELLFQVQAIGLADSARKIQSKIVLTLPGFNNP